MLKVLTTKIITIVIIAISIVGKVSAQIQRPKVGGWNAYLPYRNVIDFETSNGDVYFAISRSSFFTFNQATGELQSYSKANGMSDVDMSFVTYDQFTDKAILIYTNGNIDLFQDGKFENIPDVKISNITGDRTIYDVYANNGLVYISSGFGLIIVDIVKNEIKETVQFYSGTEQGVTKSTTGNNNSIFVASNIGLYETSLNNPLMVNYATWNHLSNIDLKLVSMHPNQNILYAASDSNLYVLQNDELKLLRNTRNLIVKIDASMDGNIWMMTQESSTVKPYAVKINASGTVIDSIPNFFSYRFLDEGDGYYWTCDGYAGLRKKSNSSTASWMDFSPQGPVANGVQKVWAKNGEIWLAHGMKSYNSWLFAGNNDAFSRYRDFNWRNWRWEAMAMSDHLAYNITDAADIIKDEKNNEVWVAYLNSGLIKVDKDDKLTDYRYGYLGQNIEGDTAGYRVSSLALDEDNNLWIGQSQAQNALRVKTNDGKWYSYRISGVTHVANIAIDDYGQKWMSAGSLGNGGLVIFNDNGTIDNPNDDIIVSKRTGENNGNLPNMSVNTIVKDKDGSMWVGTQSGIGIFSCGDIRNSGTCDADLRAQITEGFNYANYMFEGIPVKSIAVDGGNRKWVGTSVGLFLLSEDGREIIEQFTAENSPLLSNQIISVDIDPVTGVVYIATDKGLCSFGGGAVDAEGNAADPLFVFPNPVPSGYHGMISIKGMTYGSNIKITDINGQMVFQATSNGGQFSWNGRDYTGRKVQSGVYLVFVVGKDNMHKATGKFIIHE